MTTCREKFPDRPLHLIRSEADYDSMLAYLQQHRGRNLALDTETTGLAPFVADEIRGISVSTGVQSWYLPVTHPDSNNFDPHRLVMALRRFGLIFHHAVFDWLFLCQVYDDLTWWMNRTIWDTQVVNWLIDENLKVGLKPSCDRIFGEDASDEQKALKALKGYTWSTYTAEQIGMYAAKDPLLTYDLYEWQQEHLLVRGPEIPMAAVQREMAVQRCLARMISTGIKCDPERVAEGEAVKLARIDKLNQEFALMNVNPASPRQVGRWLYEDLGYPCQVWTPKGARSTAVGALEALAPTSWEARALLEHRSASKEVTAYYRPLARNIGEDGRVHPHFSSTRTVTGRFSCSNPNLQTIPKESKMPEVRRCFVPEEGLELWEYDLKQAELRVIAGYAQEETMISALDEGRDLHRETAVSIFGEERADEMRGVAKNINFSFAYGVGPVKLAFYLAPVPTKCDYWITKRGRACRACQTCEAASILDRYRQTYPRIAKLLDGMARVADDNGFVPNHVPGRYRHMRGAGYRVAGYTAVNYIVQGGIGEFMKDVMIDWYERFEANPGAYTPGRLVLQIHDAFVFEIQPGTQALMQGILQGIADKINPFKMRMIFDCKPWSDE